MAEMGAHGGPVLDGVLKPQPKASPAGFYRATSKDGLGILGDRTAANKTLSCHMQITGKLRDILALVRVTKSCWRWVVAAISALLVAALVQDRAA